MTDEEKDFYDICLEKKSLYCIRRMGEETCIKCKKYQMYKLGQVEGRKEKCLEQNNDGTIRPCEVMKDNEQLKAQIEKMKNFYNCSHSSRALCPNEHKCNGCKDWELAE